ncbi:MAG: hypothetical protein OEQ12_02820 [Nitrosopumilus sp.]|nr:hypothetical protein [Nitrosopumilus sp.]
MSNDLGSSLSSWLKSLESGSIVGDAHKGIDQVNQIVKNAIDDAGKKTIQVKAGNKTAYKTDISIDGDIANDFPSTLPKDDDVYWRRHKELVNNALEARKELQLKAIETIGTTVKSIINPISVGDVDLAGLIQTVIKSSK